MSKIAIITDTSSTIKPKEYKNVEVISMLIIIDNKKTYKDVKDINMEKLIEIMDANENIDVKTSTPLSKDFIESVERLSPYYENIVCLPLSEGLSSTYNQWHQLIENNQDKYKNVKVYKTGDTALSLRWLIEEIIKLDNENKPFNVIEDFIKNWKNRIACTVILNNLERISQGGRINKINAIISNILKIKPIIKFDIENKFLSSSITNKNAIEKSLSYFIKKLKSKKILKFGFCSSFLNKTKNNKIISEIISSIQKIFKYSVKKIEEKMYYGEISPIICSHTGKDAFSLQVLIE